MMRMTYAIVAATLLTACSPSGSDEERPQGEEPTALAADTPSSAHAGHDMSAAGSSGAMAGMDHGKRAGAASSASNGAPGHGAGHSTHSPSGGGDAAAGTQAGDPHAAMGHSRPATPGAPAASAGSHVGMTHATPAHRGSGRTKEPVDHSQMAGMDHDRPIGSQVDTPATTKLRALVAELLEDPAVRERIRSDSALSDRWRKEEVRQRLVSPPHSR